MAPPLGVATVVRCVNVSVRYQFGYFCRIARSRDLPFVTATGAGPVWGRGVVGAGAGAGAGVCRHPAKNNNPTTTRRGVERKHERRAFMIRVPIGNQLSTPSEYGVA